MELTSTGTIRVSCEAGLYRLALEVDPAIVDYARSLVPKHVRLNRTRYAPHISVVREAGIVVGTSAYDGEHVQFRYSPLVDHDDTYYWLRAESGRLRRIRIALGLMPTDWYTRPPDNQDCLHCTIGNRKL